jgi:hypothetical protein
MRPYLRLNQKKNKLKNYIKMDDFVLSNLQESRNEWCSRLISIFTPLVIEGIRSIFKESWNLCVTNNETEKYLMTFQNLLSRIPKWNSTIIEEERNRIIERSGCNYLEDLITCVHIIQLKVLTCIRVGNRQKKIDISMPKLDNFIHKIYINSARKIYMNVYLFEKNITPLQAQKNNRELEIIVQECILITIRESIPTESIIRAYMDESVEHEETVTIENLNDTEIEKIEKENKSKESDSETKEENNVEMVPSIRDMNTEEVVTRLTFNDIDKTMDKDLQKATETIKEENLDRIATGNALFQKMNDVYDIGDEKLKIHTDDLLELNDIDILDENKNAINDDIILNDIEELL